MWVIKKNSFFLKTKIFYRLHKSGKKKWKMSQYDRYSPVVLIRIISKEVCLLSKKVRLGLAVGSRRSVGVVKSGLPMLADLFWALNAHVPIKRKRSAVNDLLSTGVDWKFCTCRSSLNCDCLAFDAGYKRRNLTWVILQIFNNSHKFFYILKFSRDRLVAQTSLAVAVGFSTFGFITTKLVVIRIIIN